MKRNLLVIALLMATLTIWLNIPNLDLAAQEAVPFIMEEEQLNSNSVPPPLDMVGWWTMDESIGPVAEDLIGSQNGLYVGNPESVPGRVSNALSFSLDNYLYVTNSESLNFGPGQDFSIDAWINWQGQPDQGGAIVSKLSDTTGYELAIQNNALLLSLASSDGTQLIAQGPPVPAAEWVHIAVTVDRDSPAGIQFYVNGQPQADAIDPTDVSGSLTNEAPLLIGATNTPAPRPFWGPLDEIEIFARALLPTEIDAIYLAGEFGKCKPCVNPPAGMTGWWTFDSNNNDLALFNNALTLHNGATTTPGGVVKTLCLNGTNQYADTPDHPDLNIGPAQDFTIDAWIRTGRSDVQHQVIAEKRIVTGNQVVGYSFVTYYNQWILQLGNGTWANYHTFNSPPIADGNWHFLTAVVRHNPFSVELYTDGILVDSYTGPAISGDLTNPAPFSIGTSPGYPTHYFGGCIDEVELFKTALTATEIQAIFAAGSRGKCKCQPGVVTLLAGVKDNFSLSNGPEPASPSASLVSLLASNNVTNLANFDETAPNKYFAHTFSNLRPPNSNLGRICAAILTIRVKPLNDSLVSNDAFGFYFVPPGSTDVAPGSLWYKFFPNWQPNGPAQTITVNLANLPAGNGPTNLLGFMNTYNFLDVYVQDDTAVDWVELTLTYCCGPDLTVTKTRQAGFLSGGQITGNYELKAQNIGTSNMAGPIVVTDVLPTSLIPLGVTAPTPWFCSIVGQTVTCTHPGPLPAGQSLPPITITVQKQLPNSPRPILNCAQISPLIGDIQPNNNTGCNRFHY